MKWRLDPGNIEVVDDAIAEILRRKTPAQRLAMIGSCHRTARAIIDGAIRTFHPDWDEARIKREVARRISGGAA